MYRYVLILVFLWVGCNSTKVHFLDSLRLSGPDALTNAIDVNAALGKGGYRYMGTDTQFHYFVYYSTGWRYGAYGFKVPLSDYTPKYYIAYEKNFFVEKNDSGDLAPREYVGFYDLLGHDTSITIFLYKVDTTTQLYGYDRISLE